MKKYGESRKPDNIRDEIYHIDQNTGMERIFDEATATNSSIINLLIHNCIFSVELFASPSAVLKRVCITSPLKLWNSLSKTCREGQI